MFHNTDCEEEREMFHNISFKIVQIKSKKKDNKNNRTIQDRMLSAQYNCLLKTLLIAAF